jgi:hypothetical protein
LDIEPQHPPKYIVYEPGESSLTIRWAAWCDNVCNISVHLLLENGSLLLLLPSCYSSLLKARRQQQRRPESYFTNKIMKMFLLARNMSYELNEG